MSALETPEQMAERLCTPLRRTIVEYDAMVDAIRARDEAIKSRLIELAEAAERDADTANDAHRSDYCDGKADALRAFASTLGGDP